jgi:hypothetical protein
MTRTDEEMSLLDAALRYAKMGIPVLPLFEIIDGECACGNLRPHKKGKHPRVGRGVYGASVVPPQIQTWWTTWPDANIGGAIPKGVYVVEIDSAAGFEALKTAGVLIPSTAPQARSGRDGFGLHVWLRSPLELPNVPDGGVVQDVGLRGYGAYVVMPPSLHLSGRRYRWEVPL